MMFGLGLALICLLSAAANAQDVRLVNGATPSEGRVEVFCHGAWGTVCDDFWDLTDANVVCRYLGLGEAVEASGLANFGEGNGDIYLDDVDCTGSETSIFECANRGLRVHNCVHGEDAGAKCSLAPAPLPEDTDLEIRLVDGAGSEEGRVEVYYNGAWGTVCDDLWDDTDAGVVCTSLGLGNTGTAIWYAGFGQGTGDIILDDVQCTGSESNLASCPNRGLGVHNCGHSEDAGVLCSGGGTDLEVRLVDGANSNEGRVEVYYNGAWGTVCDDLWDDTDAGVVCSSLGLGNTGTAVSSAGFGQGTGDIILDDVQCTGSESNLASCPNRGLGVHNCAHSEDAGVRCSGGDTGVQTRLANGASSNEGRVEVYYNGAWGTVCDDYWDDTDAGVVCRSLGLGQAGTASSNAAFGQGSGDIVLDDVRCTGSESNILECPNLGLGSHNCGHHEDAGVSCY